MKTNTLEFIGSIIMTLVVLACVTFLFVIIFAISADINNKVVNQQAVAAQSVVKVLWTDYYRTVIVETPDGKRHRVDFNYKNTNFPVVGETWKVDKDMLFLEKAQ